MCSASPWLWFTALCSHSALGAAVLGKINVLVTLQRVAELLCPVGQCQAGWGRAGSGVAAPPSPPHTPLTFTLTFYSFLSFPMTKCLFSPPFKHCLTVLQTLLKIPLVMHLKPFLNLGEAQRLKQGGEQAVIKNVIYSACWHQPTPLILKHLNSGHFDLYTEISCYFFNCCIFLPGTSRAINKSVKPAASAVEVSVQAPTKVMFTEVFFNSSFSLQCKKWVQHG